MSFEQSAEQALIVLFVGLAAAVIVTAIMTGIGFAARITGRSGTASKDDEMLIQEMHRKLNRMDQRIEALETILTAEEQQRNRR